MRMIPLSDAGLQTETPDESVQERWQWHLQNAITDVPTLARLLELELAELSTDFPLLVPLPYLHRMEKGNPADPLLLQVLPRAAENLPDPGYTKDPLQELHSTSQTRGLIQKYHGRVLVITTGACAINCRYCFRRHFPYEAHHPGRADWNGIIEYLQANASVNEVILSGGDPLVMNDRYLGDVISGLERVDSLHTVRVHTRLPVVIPQRICNDLLAWVSESKKQLVFVMHINHPAEIDKDVISSMAALKYAGVTLLNQSVLLRDINDTLSVQIALSRRLFEAGILPYYLHLLDPVAGAAHFNVTEDEGKKLMEQLSGQLPGYLVPKLAREVPGATAKQVIVGT